MTACRPLDDVLREVALREPALHVQAGPPTGPGWSRADLLLAPGRFEDLLHTRTASLVAEHPRASARTLRAVAASVLVTHWGWALAVPAAGLFAATGQVLDLHPSHVHLHVRDGELDGVAVERVSRTAGERGLCAQLTDHLARLHAVASDPARVQLRRSARAWNGATGDAVAAALLQQSRHVPPADASRLLALVDDLLARVPSWGEPGWLVVDSPPSRTRRRTTCCLWYRLPEQDPCLTCPRLPDDERRARLLAQHPGLMPT